MLDTSKLIKSHLHVKCDFFSARNAKGPYLVSISKLGSGNYTALIGPILPGEGLYSRTVSLFLNSKVPIGIAMTRDRWQV